MRRFLTLMALTALVGCSDQEFHHVNYSQTMGSLVISGRVCDPQRNTWLEDAIVYTHFIDEEGTLYHSEEALTDAQGFYTLENIVPDRTYTVFVQHGSTSLDMFQVEVESNDVILEEPECGGSSTSSVALITGDYEDYEAVLTQVGVGSYDLIDGQIGDTLAQFLSDPEALAQYDALFFPGGHREEDVIYDTDGSDTAGVVPQVLAALTDYVQSGGTIYASDWSYDVIETLWPDMVDFWGEDTLVDDAQVGEPATLTATVSDSGLKQALGGDKVDISFDLDAWPVMKYAGNARVYMKATAPVREGTEVSSQEDAPLMVSFPAGEGKVFFTSWRWTSNTKGRGLESIEFMIANM